MDGLGMNGQQGGKGFFNFCAKISFFVISTSKFRESSSNDLR